MWPVLGMEGGHGDGEEGWEGRTWRWNVCRCERQSRVLGTPASWLRPLDRRWCPSLKWKMKGEEEVWRWHTKQALLFSELNRNVSGSGIRLRCVSSPVPAPPPPPPIFSTQSWRDLSKAQTQPCHPSPKPLNESPVLLQ